MMLRVCFNPLWQWSIIYNNIITIIIDEKILSIIKAQVIMLRTTFPLTE